MQKKSVAFKLLRNFLLSTLVPFILCTFLITLVYAKTYSSNMNQMIGTTMQSMSSNISTYIEELKKVTLMPYYSDTIYYYINAMNEGKTISTSQKINSQKVMDSSFTFVRHSREDTNGIFIVNPRTCVYYTVNNFDHLNLESAYDYEHQQWYQNAITADGRAIVQGPHYADYLVPTSKEPVISVLRSIVKLETREPLGVIKIDINNSLFEEIFKDLSFPVSSKIIITDDQEQILYANRALNENEQLKLAPKSGGDIQLTDGSWKIFSYDIKNTPWKIKVLLSNSELMHTLYVISFTALLLYLTSIGVAIGFYFYLSHKIVKAVEEMRSLFHSIQNKDLTQRYTYTSDTELDTLGESLNVMTRQLDEQIKKEYLMTIKQKESEFEALQAQIHPHFLFNTLNNFIALNQTGQREKLEDALYMLADLMRYTLKAPSRVLLTDELRTLKAYCTLQELRFDDRLCHKFIINADIDSVFIPKLLLQPLVENSVLHGIEPGRNVCTITISVSPYQNGLLIVIEDDGIGFDTETLKKSDRIGVHNVKERLEIFSPGSSFAIISSPGQGTQNRIYLEINESTGR